MAKRRKAPTFGNPPAGAVEALLGDPDLLQQLLSALNGTADQGVSLAEQLEDYIASFGDDEIHVDDEEALGRAADLQGLLTDLRISSNGGDRGAREELDDGLAFIAAAAEARDISGPAMMALFQLFGMAEVDPGDALREALLDAMVAARESGAPVESRLAGGVAGLAELDGDASQMILAAMIRYMPQIARHELVGSLGGQAHDTPRTALLGCMLDSDAELVRIAANGLIASAPLAPVPSRFIERLVLIRGLVPAAMHPSVDAAIAALRPKAAAPVGRQPLQLVKCVASVCDGAGAQSLMVLIRHGKTSGVVTFLVKTHEGIADAMVVDGFSRRQFDSLAREMGVVLVPVPLPVILRRLAIALAVNHALGTPAAFSVVQALEALGIPALRPEPVETETLLDELLIGSDILIPTTLTEAAGRLDDAEMTETWFEAGPQCDERLDTLRGAKQRNKAALAYIEERRAYWAAQCANAALILHGGGKPLGPLWYDFALLGKHFAGKAPMADNPLAKAMARRTVEAHEGQIY